VTPLFTNRNSESLCEGVTHRNYRTSVCEVVIHRESGAHTLGICEVIRVCVWCVCVVCSVCFVCVVSVCLVYVGVVCVCVMHVCVVCVLYVSCVCCVLCVHRNFGISECERSLTGKSKIRVCAQGRNGVSALSES